MNDAALYLEVDEDITSAIDKLSKTAGSTVQIVVPKRSTMLQSVINLKLLKKAAAESGKELVLVTNDRIATDLAARVGLAVATALGGKAILSAAAIAAPVSNEDIIEEDDPMPVIEPVKPIAKPSPPVKKPLFARRDVSETAIVPVAAALAGAEADASLNQSPAADVPKSGPKVPDFNRLQRRMLWVGAAVVVVGGYFVLMSVFETAKITLYAAATKVNIDTTFSVDPSLHSTDAANAMLAGQTVTFSKDLSSPFTPTGTKDVGTKAGGTMTVKNEYDNNAHMLQSGTRFVAPDGKIFRSVSDVSVPGAGVSGGHVTPGSVQVTVTADQNGDAYNEAPAKYTIPGLPADQQASIYGQGAQMSGGTTKTVTVVTQKDVDTARDALLAKDKDGSQKNLEGNVPAGLEALPSSAKQAADSIVSTPAVDSEASTASLSLKVTYTELAVKKSELADVINKAELKQIGATNQIYDDGLAAAQITPTDSTAAGQNFHFTTEAYGGAKLDVPAITAQIKGKKYGDATDTLSKLPGVQRSEITLWPAWAFKLPGRTSQIKITIQVASNKG